MKKIFIINGPNLNFLGIRETGIYGNDNYDSLCSYIQEKFYDKNVKIEIFQSNYEGRIIDILQNAYYEKIDKRLGKIRNRKCGRNSQKLNTVRID